MAALERPRELEDLMKARRDIDDKIARLNAVRSGMLPEFYARGRELSAKIRTMVPCAQHATAWFDDGSVRVEIRLNNANTISRAEFRDGPERHCGWVLQTCSLAPSTIPLAPIRRSPGYTGKSAQKSLCDTMIAQRIVGRRVLERLIAIEEEYACCMFPEGTTPANYAPVRADEKGLLSVDWE